MDSPVASSSHEADEWALVNGEAECVVHALMRNAVLGSDQSKQRLYVHRRIEESVPAEHPPLTVG